MTTIPANQIVDVNPEVISAGGAALDLNGLMLTTNTRAPIGSVLEFSTVTDVSTYFGAGSAEVAAVTIYFNGYDNSPEKPGSILISQYPLNAVAAYMRGGNVSSLTNTQLQALSGNLAIAVDGYAWPVANISLSAATSFSNAATIIQGNLTAAPPQQASFTGNMTGTQLTVSAVGSGTIGIGQNIVGAGVATGTIVTAFGTGNGTTGTYTINQSQTIGSEAMTAKATAFTVTYDSVSGGFIVTSGITGAQSTMAQATGTLNASLKLTTATGALLSQGAVAATPSAFMDSIVAITQNWAAFKTLFDPDNGSGNTQKLAFATWVNNQDDRYAYIVGDSDITATNTVPATTSLGYLLQQNNYSGTFPIWETSGLGLANFVLGVIASIDFQQTNGRPTFAFKRQTGLTPSVTNATVASNLIANGYNFYGAYATANQQFTWLYPGSVSGPFKWMDSYVDQIWLNNAFQLALMELLDNVPSIPYNSAGRGLIEAALADPINAALNFGAIRPGVTLSAAQIAEVNNAAGLIIAPTLQTRGWYLQIGDATPQVRAARGSPPCNFWYVDGGSVQQITLASIELQ